MVSGAPIQGVNYDRHQLSKPQVTQAQEHYSMTCRQPPSKRQDTEVLVLRQENAGLGLRQRQQIFVGASPGFRACPPDVVPSSPQHLDQTPGHVLVGKQARHGHSVRR